MSHQIEEINQLSSNEDLQLFAQYVLSQTPENGLPNYKKLNLMEIPRLVPHVFVFDVLKSTDCLIMHYCGTQIDRFYGVNMTGRAPLELFKGEGEYTEVEANFRMAINNHSIAYARRAVHLVNDYSDKHRVAESILFPCSSDGEVIDYAFGFADYYGVKQPVKRCITQVT